MKIRFRSALLAAALAAAAAAPAQAQDFNLQVVPKIGAFSPLNTLTRDAEVELGLAIGAAAELLLPRLPFDVRVNVDHATGADIIARDPSEAVLGTVSLTAVVADVVVRPLAATARFQPYFLAGGGVKAYAWDVPAAGTAELFAATATSRRAALHVGGGVDVRFGPAAVLLEIGDYVSTMPAGDGGTRLQNDLFGMLGFRVSMF